MKKKYLFILLFLFFGFQITGLYANDDLNIGQNSPQSANSIKPGEDGISDAQSQQPRGSTPDTNTTTSSSDNILGVDDKDLRTGNVSMNTIPIVIVNVINVLLGLAGTIAVVALIYYALQMQINSGITGDSSGVESAKKGMKGAVLGFIVAILAWFIVIRFVEILSGLS